MKHSISRSSARACLFVLGLGSAAVGVACTSSDDAPAGGLNLPDGGFDVAAPDRDASGSVSGDGAATDGEPAGDGGIQADATTDSASPVDAGPIDPFQPHWRMPVDVPSSGDFVVDSDAGIITQKSTGLQWANHILADQDLPPDAGGGYAATQAEARAQCSQATIGGLTGWRLPTRMEWMATVALDDYVVFPSPTFKSNEYAGVAYMIATNDPTRLETYEGHYHNHTFIAGSNWGGGAIACVRTPFPVAQTASAPPAGRFVVDTATVTDTVTHLVWARAWNQNALFKFQADDYCANLASADAGNDAGVDAGAKPWRVPTVKEFASLWNEVTGLPPELDTGSDIQYFWTSTAYVKPVIGGEPFFRFTFMKAKVATPGGDFFWDATYNVGPVRCVRDLD
ncbi:MAG: DUF1566 domain-containing protein [Polyangiaceae bacterium]